MRDIKEIIYTKSPHLIQNCIISLYNIIAYKKRYSKTYKKYINHYKKNNNLTIDELKKIQSNKYSEFIAYAMQNSLFYKKKYEGINAPENINNISKLPIIDKETLRTNVKDIYTLNKSQGIISKTGGTTGKSLEVIYLQNDIEERFAILDNFRNNFGYSLGKKTAWFSGKNLLKAKDLKNNRFWKTDYFYNVRYYSTFHIHDKYLAYYINNIIKFKPEFMVGFPSTMYDIAMYGIKNNIEFPANTIKAIFPTAETITKEIRNILETYFKTSLYDQYASSEGAPFIVECKNKKLHLELQSGVYEVLDDYDKNTTKGRLVVTSFNTHGTPLIRYDIGDQIELDESETCSCTNQNPIVKNILGRVSDYIFSEETGKINLGNISNCLKGVKGIIRFQIIQNEIDKITVLIINDPNVFTKHYENIFIHNLRERTGQKLNIKLEYVKDIPVEKSGKFRLIKNNIKNKK